MELFIRTESHVIYVNFMCIFHFILYFYKTVCTTDFNRPSIQQYLGSLLSDLACNVEIWTVGVSIFTPIFCLGFSFTPPRVHKMSLTPETTVQIK